MIRPVDNNNVTTLERSTILEKVVMWVSPFILALITGLCVWVSSLDTKVYNLAQTVATKAELQQVIMDVRDGQTELMRMMREDKKETNRQLDQILIQLNTMQKD